MLNFEDETTDFKIWEQIFWAYTNKTWLQFRIIWPNELPSFTLKTSFTFSRPKQMTSPLFWNLSPPLPLIVSGLTFVSVLLLSTRRDTAAPLTCPTRPHSERVFMLRPAGLIRTPRPQSYCWQVRFCSPAVSLNCFTQLGVSHCKKNKIIITIKIWMSS